MVLRIKVCKQVLCPNDQLLSPVSESRLAVLVSNSQLLDHLDNKVKTIFKNPALTAWGENCHTITNFLNMFQTCVLSVLFRSLHINALLLLLTDCMHHKQIIDEVMNQSAFRHSNSKYKYLSLIN